MKTITATITTLVLAGTGVALVSQATVAEAGYSIRQTSTTKPVELPDGYFKPCPKKPTQTGTTCAARRLPRR